MNPADLMAEIPSGKLGRSAIAADVLALLILLDDGEQSVAEVRDVLRIPQATASDLVKRSMFEGWTIWNASEEDRRKHLVSLTAKGQRARKRRRGASQAPATAEVTRRRERGFCDHGIDPRGCPSC